MGIENGAMTAQEILAAAAKHLPSGGGGDAHGLHTNKVKLLEVYIIEMEKEIIREARKCTHCGDPATRRFECFPESVKANPHSSMGKALTCEVIVCDRADCLLEVKRSGLLASREFSLTQTSLIRHMNKRDSLTTEYYINESVKLLEKAVELIPKTDDWIPTADWLPDVRRAVKQAHNSVAYIQPPQRKKEKT